MQLSEHFALEEGVDSPTAIRLGIDNHPDYETIARMRTAAGLMEQVRAILGHPIRVNSWFRCEALEKVITHNDYVRWCGVHGHAVDEASWALYFARKGHPKGYAVDFVCPEFGNPLEIVLALQRTDIKFDQLIQEGTWVHISADPQQRMEVMTATFINGTPMYTKGA